MALGGGPWVTQNKVMPGTYENFVSAKKAFLNLSDRGYVALPMALSWGDDAGVIELDAETFDQSALTLLGYESTAPELKSIRDVFRGAKYIYLQRLALTGAAAATSDFGDAIYKGTRGNDLSIVIAANVDNPANFNVTTMLGTQEVEVQLNVASSADLVDNEFIKFDKTSTLAVTAGTPLTGGVDGTGVETGSVHQAALDMLEMYGFNVLICASSDATIKAMYVAYNKRLRDEVGLKFQVAVHKAVTPDFEGVINVQNDAVGDGEEVFGMVYWNGGVSAGVNVNSSNTNRLYDGEHTPSMAETDTQSKLIQLIKEGKFAMHRVGQEIRVLRDINSFVSFTPEKGEDFSANQVIRVIDQAAIDTANIFNTRYLGKVPNDSDGRISLWNDILTQRLEMQRIRAIENYDAKKLIVGPGIQKNGVVASEELTVTWAMEKLYITTVVA